MTARRTAVVAEMSDIGRAIVVRAAAADAVLRVRGVLKRASRDARIVHTEDDRPGMLEREVAELRIVAVDRKSSLGRQRVHGSTPARRDVLELSVAIELVPEEIGETQRSGTQSRGDLRECGLVDLEQAELCIARFEQRRRDSRNKVCAGIVVREAHSTVRECVPSSRPSSSCRSSRRAALIRAAGGHRAGRLRRGRVATAACLESSCRRLRRRSGRACPPHVRRRSRQQVEAAGARRVRLSERR